jgi:hypothetical protein
VLLERRPEVATPADGAAYLFVLSGLEEGKALTSVGFGLVESDVGVLHQVVDGAPVLGSLRNADARIDLEQLSGHVVGLADRTQQAGCQAFCVAPAPGIALENDELVTSKASDNVRRSRRLSQPASDAFQKGISNRVSERVVHLFELVEIDPVDGNLRCSVSAPLRAARDRNRLAMLVGIVPGEPGYLLLCAPLLAMSSWGPPTSLASG